MPVDLSGMTLKNSKIQISIGALVGVVIAVAMWWGSGVASAISRNSEFSIKTKEEVVELKIEKARSEECMKNIEARLKSIECKIDVLVSSKKPSGE